MEYEKAKEIVGIVIEWQFWLMGIKNRPTEYLDKNISLQDLIDANKAVKKFNEEHREKYSGTGKSFKQHQTLADRVIAAVYTALNFETNGEACIVINGIGVGCVVMQEAEKIEDDE